MHRKRIVGTALLAAALVLAAGACGEDDPSVSAAGQEPGGSESTATTSDVSPSSEAASTTSEVPASSEPASSSSTSEAEAEPGGVASATYLPEGYEAASSEESAPGVTSKRYRYPTSETEPPRVIIVRTISGLSPEDAAGSLEGVREVSVAGARAVVSGEGAPESGGDGLSIRWAAADGTTLYELVNLGPLDNAEDELIRIGEALQYDQA